MSKCEHCGQEMKKCNQPCLQNLEQFLNLVENQFVYGGTKYAHSKEKESTDILFDDFGKNWLLGTIAKYCKRYTNLARERDLLKIACYMFIMWLKRGFHLKEKGSYEVIDTTVAVKKEYFPIFIKNVKTYMNSNIMIKVENPIIKIYDILKECADSIFCITKEEKFLEVFQLSYHIWNKDIKEKGKDEDVFNEKRGKEKVK